MKNKFKLKIQMKMAKKISEQEETKAVIRDLAES